MDEITAPVDLGSPAGALNPAAVGFARSALHRPVVPSGAAGGWRTKRWEYWGIVTPDLVLGMTIAHLDYASTLQFYVLERASGKETSAEPLKLLPSFADVSVPDALPPLTAFGSFGGATLRFHDADGGTHLHASSARISADLFAAADGDVLGVVVPWSERRYQYTLKDVARRVCGSVTVDGREYTVGGEDSFAVLDRGRGRWPYSRRWNWGVGSGTVDGTRLGLQFGGKWTAGTPATENALIVDGRLHHYDGELEFEYDLTDPASTWRVRGPWIDAVLTPFHRRTSATNAVVIKAQVWQAFGTWAGTARTPDGTEYSLDGLTGWIEEARNRW
ncbi:DUF2804 domain-containing protein [Arthrobacter zhangbolii]|uniref:DUF2804 domain-containing protein n=1 Tax=Arthrobacter zhangbolii TaxID=2886936 RepID=A0A9X1MAC8_9MICC|nr:MULTISPECIES: DUF2804 domain-containing protein [Arthrobacter]MCC3274223.1 DUF2804 domain-containing protein [Arthrobacter zhangbolii]MDN3902918.1 DUF2804 domain-containing protein [Arthrobacter sp. YD2]UON92252.1 DUF2804 domain-containing protein [Arthrobacter zhangbolii]